VALERIVADPEPPNPKAEKLAKKEAADFGTDKPRQKTKPELDRERLQLLNDRLGHENTRLKWDNRLRLAVAIGVFGIVFLWLIAVAVMLVLQALPNYLKLPDNVNIALLATSTLNVVGLLFTVVNYLFPKQQNHKSEEPVKPKVS
jgi:hypothetical protein